MRSLPPTGGEREVGQRVRPDNGQRRERAAGSLPGRVRPTKVASTGDGTVTVPDEEGGTRLLIRLVVVGVALWLTILLLPGPRLPGPSLGVRSGGRHIRRGQRLHPPGGPTALLPLSILTLGLFALVVKP